MRLEKWFASQEGITQLAFARSVGVTQGRVAQLLQGEMPSLSLAMRIREVTEGAVTPDDFISRNTRPREKVK